MKDDILTIREVAEMLKLTEKTAYRLVSNGELPGFKAGGSWRFRQSEIDKWIFAREADSKNAGGETKSPRKNKL
jgi:excisionase family DNA binding protein